MKMDDSAELAPNALPAAFNDAATLFITLTELCDPERICTALVDVTRYTNIEQCAAALEMDPATFAAMPNLYANYSPALKAQGPRLYCAPLWDPRWSFICRESLRRQAATFIVHDGDTRSLQEHLKSLIKVPQADGSKLLFRFQDAVVLSTLAPLMTPSQQHVLLGPARQWLVLDVCGNPALITGESFRGPRQSSLVLSSAQKNELDMGLWPATIIAQSDDTDSTLLQGKNKCQRWQIIRQAIARAQGHGLKAQEDVALYSVLSLQLPDGFDHKGPVADALQRASIEGISFGAAIDQVPAEQWRALDENMAQ